MYIQTDLSVRRQSTRPAGAGGSDAAPPCAPGMSAATAGTCPGTANLNTHTQTLNKTITLFCLTCIRFGYKPVLPIPNTVKSILNRLNSNEK